MSNLKNVNFSYGPLVLGMLLGFVPQAVRAQGLLALPASDPVGIARSGVGVAYGRSLEASAQNPALLVTVPDRTTAYLAGGLEFQSSQATLFSNQKTYFTSDRNRPIAAFGVGWKLMPALALGLKLDMPFMRHGQISPESAVRFHGESLDLKTQRAELQLSWAVSDRFSIGVAAGAAQVNFSSGVALRAVVLENSALPPSSTNNLGMLERSYVQEGKATVPSYSLGFRWAVNTRWTIGGAVRSPLRGNLSLTAQASTRPTSYYDAETGLVHEPLDGIEPKANQLLAASKLKTGSDKFELPGTATLGVRQRVNQLLTWELDLTYVASSRYELPSHVSLGTPQGTVKAPDQGTARHKNGLSVGVMGEIILGKDWVARGGFSLDSPFREDSTVEPLMGGSRTAAFSAGFGYKVLGGELNLGYQFRQARDIDTSKLDGAWSVYGFRTTGTPIRVENMGHIFSVGFRKAF